MPDTTLIANGTVVTAEGEFSGDVLIEGETIAAVGRVAAPEGRRRRRCQPAASSSRG